MSNAYLNSTVIYNAELKEVFISKFAEKTQNMYRRIFYYSAAVEEMYKMDMYDFNLGQISDVLKSIDASSLDSVRSAVSVIRSYIDFAIHHRTNNVNPLDIIDTEWMEQFVDTSKKLLFSYDEIWNQIIPRCKNAQDSVIIALLFEGVSGVQVSEIRNLRHEDVNFENSELTLRNEKDEVRTLKVSNECMKIIKEAMIQDVYIKRNGSVSPNTRTRETNDLLDTGYIIKPAKTQNVHMEQVNPHVIYGRLSTIGELLDYPNFTYKNIERSGMIWIAKQILDRDGHFGDKEQYFEICERFNIGKLKNGAYNWTRIKEKVNQDIVEQVYSESSLS